jgi:hypothetical protein
MTPLVLQEQFWHDFISRTSAVGVATYGVWKLDLPELLHAQVEQLPNAAKGYVSSVVFVVLRFVQLTFEPLEPFESFVLSIVR